MGTLSSGETNIGDTLTKQDLRTSRDLVIPVHMSESESGNRNVNTVYFVNHVRGNTRVRLG